MAMAGAERRGGGIAVRAAAVWRTAWRGVACGVARLLHELRRFRLSAQLHEREWSILSSDCVGGVMAHDLRLRFDSPTVNLFFDSNEGFVDYVAGLDYYRDAELLACGAALRGDGREYPVARLAGDGEHPEVVLHFLHYRTFEEAARKWRERSRRLRPERLCVVMHVKELDRSLLDRFAALPVVRKVILGYPASELEHPLFFKVSSLARFEPGRLLRYAGITGRRYLDDFDYVAFLNDGTIRASR
ncbi:MAG: DUF1919 domain-containing protein [Alistipes sp.]|nr:DUF1919 domain-containing protein [Alistipes sp.]